MLIYYFEPKWASRFSPTGVEEDKRNPFHADRIFDIPYEQK